MSTIRIVTLGGVRENGKSMYAIEVNDDVFILDAGLKYPENNYLGIDYVIPGFDYLEENSSRIQGVFLTHGHSDAIGALPFLVGRFDVPVFGSELTIALAKITCESEQIARKFKDFHVVNESTEIDFEEATVSFFKTTHSVPESLGICIKTDEGSIVYTGDFRFDQTAAPGYKTDYGRLAQIGDDGVLALLSDSGNAENPKQAVDENDVAQSIQETFDNHDGRIIVACIASKLMRIQQVFDAAQVHGRKVFLTGHDAHRIVQTAISLGKLTVEPDLLGKVGDLKKYKDNQIVIVETGHSGEPLKTLQKMAQGRHRRINLHEGDLVFITTTPSPSYETVVAKTRDMIYHAGAEVKALFDDLSSSDHASHKDLQLLMNILNPRYVFPVRGEYRLLDANAKAAEEIGVEPDHIIIMNKGSVAEYDRGKFVEVGSVDAPDVMVDGLGIGDIGNIVLRDRRILSEDGIFIAVVTINRRRKKIVGTPKVTSRGFIYTKTSKDLITESKKIIVEEVEKNLDNKDFDWSHIKQNMRDKLSHFLYEQTKRSPVILPVIMELNQKPPYKKSFTKATPKKVVKKQKSKSK